MRPKQYTVVNIFIRSRLSLVETIICIQPRFHISVIINGNKGIKPLGHKEKYISSLDCSGLSIFYGLFKIETYLTLQESFSFFVSEY